MGGGNGGCWCFGCGLFDFYMDYMVVGSFDLGCGGYDVYYYEWGNIVVEGGCQLLVLEGF